MDITELQTHERFKFIEFLLLFKGQLTRSELVERFGIGEATASRLIKSYIDKNPNQENYLGPRLGYVKADTFQIEYKHDALDGLRYVASGKLLSQFKVVTYGLTIHSFNQSLSTELVAPVTRAIVGLRYVSLDYISSSSGISSRVIAPHSLFMASGTWYFRAYDMQSSTFRTFKFSRIKNAVTLGEIDNVIHSDIKDDSWHQMRAVKLKPHPKLEHAEAIELELQTSPVKDIYISEATLGFAMSELRVDCSKKHKLSHVEYPLILVNRDELENVDSMVLAPGFLIT